MVNNLLVILDLSGVSMIDTSGAFAIDDIIANAAAAVKCLGPVAVVQAVQIAQQGRPIILAAPA